MKEAGDQLQIIQRSAKSVDEMQAHVRAHFCSGRFEIAPGASRGQARTHTSLSLQRFGIDRYQAVGGVISGIAPRSYELAFTMQGGIKVQRGTEEHTAMAGGDVVAFGGAGSRVKIDTLPGSLVYSVWFAPPLMETAGRNMLGNGFKPDPNKSFDPRTDASRAFVRNASAIFSELTELEKAGLSTLAGSVSEDLLVNLAIAAMYHDQFGNLQTPASSARIVTRAQEIIVARAAEPVSIQDVALEVGVTVRTLQLEFRKHLGSTPMQFLIHRRLTLAREKLLNPELRGNVQSVAMSCGFANMSKFSSRYRIAFGELPSATLARGRRG